MSRLCHSKGLIFSLKNTPMTIPFSRSIRSMRDENRISSIVAIALLSIILILWLAWFFRGEIPVYAKASSFTLMENGLIEAYFPEQVMADILPGQSVEVMLGAGETNAAPTLKGELSSLPTYPGDPVIIYMYHVVPANPGPSSSLRVITGTTTPFSIVWDNYLKRGN